MAFRLCPRAAAAKLLLTIVLVCAAVVSSAGQDTALVGVWSTDAVKTAYRATDNRNTRKYEDGLYPNGPIVTQKGGSPAGPALVIDFRIDENTLVGKVTDFVSGTEFEIEGFSASGSKFEFTTNRKVANVMVRTTYRGQRADDGTIAIERLANGKPIDTKADGTPNTLIFRRATAPLPSPPSLPPPLLPRAANH